jgi:N-methylhydantoinase B/oxoprolinase/acetone carboxylase alpha subunit
MSLLADRRSRAPYGLDGGADGKRGSDFLIKDGRRRPISSKGNWQIEAGARVRIETPGGGGHGQEDS